MKLFGGRLKVNLLLIPALVLIAVFGQFRALLFYMPALIIHEWSHILAAKGLGLCLERFELLPFGCSAHLTGYTMSRSREVIVAAAGPAVNMVAASAVLLIDRYFTSLAWAEEFITANVAIAAINFLPALPLDGGHIARAAFSSFLGRKRATKVTAIMGVFFSVVLTGFGIAVVIDGQVNIGFFIMGLFLCLSAIRELRSAPYELIRDFSSKRHRLSRHKTISINRIGALCTDKLSDVMGSFEAGKYNVVTVLGKDMQSLGELDERVIIDAVMQRGAHATLASILNKADSCFDSTAMIE